jgi:hypothetical protein
MARTISPQRSPRSRRRRSDKGGSNHWRHDRPGVADSHDPSRLTRPPRNPGGALAPNPDEIASTHSIRLETIDGDDAVVFVTIPESPRPVIRLRIGDGFVHAPTAAMVYQLREPVAGRMAPLGASADGTAGARSAVPLVRGPQTTFNKNRDGTKIPVERAGTTGNHP